MFRKSAHSLSFWGGGIALEMLASSLCHFVYYHSTFNPGASDGQLSHSSFRVDKLVPIADSE